LHPPQCAVLTLVSAHWPEQQLSFPWQQTMFAPLPQTRSLRQHAPAISVVAASQAVAKQVPLAHATAVEWETLLVSQCTKQAPQFCRSLSMSAQVPAQQSGEVPVQVAAVQLPQ
jgi:hypothetical protein